MLAKDTDVWSNDSDFAERNVVDNHSTSHVIRPFDTIGEYVWSDGLYNRYCQPEQPEPTRTTTDQPSSISYSSVVFQR